MRYFTFAAAGTLVRHSISPRPSLSQTRHSYASHICRRRTVSSAAVRTCFLLHQVEAHAAAVETNFEVNAHYLLASPNVMLRAQCPRLRRRHEWALVSLRGQATYRQPTLVLTRPCHLSTCGARYSKFAQPATTASLTMSGPGELRALTLNYRPRRYASVDDVECCVV